MISPRKSLIEVDNKGQKELKSALEIQTKVDEILHSQKKLYDYSKELHDKEKEINETQ